MRRPLTSSWRAVERASGRVPPTVSHFRSASRYSASVHWLTSCPQAEQRSRAPSGSTIALGSRVALQPTGQRCRYRCLVNQSIPVERVAPPR